MATVDGKVEKAMTPEEWEVNKSCEAKKRAHKWQWKYDINTCAPSSTEAFCVHCGMERTLRNDGFQENG